MLEHEYGAPIDLLWPILWRHSQVGLAVVATDWRIIRCNQMFAECLEFSPEELRGRHVSSITHDSDAHTGIMAAESGSVEFSKRYITKSGKAVWCHLRSDPVKFPDGKTTVWLSQISRLPDEAYSSIAKAIERRIIDKVRKDQQHELDEIRREFRSAVETMNQFRDRDNVDIRIGGDVGRDKTTSNVTNKSWLIGLIVLAVAAIAGVKVASEWFTAETPTNNQGQQTAPPNLPATPQDGDE